MKKIYTIGREEGCDIIIPDNSNVISRLHATIRIESEDRIYITDQSRNGTYVNGMKISSNVEVPVSRKDVISFAHIVDFDWSLIPRQKNKYLKWAIIIVPFIIIVGFVAFSLLAPDKPANTPASVIGNRNESNNEAIEQDTIVQDTIAQEDTLAVKPKEPVKVQSPQKEKKKDSVKVEKPKEEIYNPIY